MHKYQKAALSIAFLTLILSGGLSYGAVASASGTINNSNRNQEEKILETFENDDYDAWKKLLAKKGKLVEAVEREDFDSFVLARKLARQGRYDEAISLSENLEKRLKFKLSSEYIV